MPDFLADTPSLSSVDPLTTGKESHIYQHPVYDNILLKVPRRQSVHFRRHAKPGPKRYAVWRYRGLLNWYREYEEYLAAIARNEALPAFMPHLFGFVSTDLGPAMAVERIAGPDGGLAPSLADLARAGGIDDEIRILVDRFFDEIAESGIVTHDLHPGNLVVADAPRRLVLIEGLGDRTLIRSAVFSDRARRAALARRKKRLLTAIAAPSS